jgi:hypothetical protein
MCIDEEIVQGRLIASLELHTEKNVLFSKTTTYTPNNIYKVLTVIDDAKNSIINLSANNILITNEQMYATRDEITQYYRNDLLLDNPSKDRTKPITDTKAKKSTNAKAKPKKEPIMVTRVRLFNKISKKIAQEKNLPDDKNQTVYDSFQPPMTKQDYYNFIGKDHLKIFSANHGDFFRGDRVGIKFSEAARSRK